MTTINLPNYQESNPAMDLGHMNVVLEWCMCMMVVTLGMIIINIIMIIISQCAC